MSWVKERKEEHVYYKGVRDHFSWLEDGTGSSFVPVLFFLHQFAGFLRAHLYMAHLPLWPHLSPQAIGQGWL